jgi:non-specific serine/threonine protein kinase
MAWALQAPMSQAREMGLRLAGALWCFWFVRSHFAEGREWLERLLAATDDRPTAARAKALFAAGMLAEGLPDPATSAARHEASLAIARAIGNQTLQARAHFGLGDASRMHGQHVEATQHYAAALSLFRALGDRAWSGITLNGMAVAAFRGGALDQATRLAEEALSLLTEAGDPWSVAETTAIVAETARLRRDLPRAATLYAQAIVAWRNQGDQHATAVAVEWMAAVAVAQGWAEEAARLAGASAAARAAIQSDDFNKPQVTREGASAVTEARQALGETAFEQAWAAGQTLSLEMAVAEARALAERLAEVIDAFRRLGDPEDLANALASSGHALTLLGDQARATETLP